MNVPRLSRNFNLNSETRNFPFARRIASGANAPTFRAQKGRASPPAAPANSFSRLALPRTHCACAESGGSSSSACIQASRASVYLRPSSCMRAPAASCSSVAACTSVWQLLHTKALGARSAAQREQEDTGWSVASLSFSDRTQDTDLPGGGHPPRNADADEQDDQANDALHRIGKPKEWRYQSNQRNCSHRLRNARFGRVTRGLAYLALRLRAPVLHVLRQRNGDSRQGHGGVGQQHCRDLVAAPANAS